MTKYVCPKCGTKLEILTHCLVAPIVTCRCGRKMKPVTAK